jgi:hypothetical protein
MPPISWHTAFLSLRSSLKQRSFKIRAEACLQASQAWRQYEYCVLELRHSSRYETSVEAPQCLESNHNLTMEYLKGEGLKIDLTNNHGARPIHIAADRGYVGVVKWLLQCGEHAPDYADGYLPVHLAARNGHLGVIQYLRDVVGLSVVGS